MQDFVTLAADRDIRVLVIEVLRQLADLAQGEVLWRQARIRLTIDEIAEPMLQRPVVVVDELDAEEHVLEDVHFIMSGLQQPCLDLDEEVAITGSRLKPSLVRVEPHLIRETIEHLANEGARRENLAGLLNPLSVLSHIECNLRPSRSLESVLYFRYY